MQIEEENKTKTSKRNKKLSTNVHLFILISLRTSSKLLNDVNSLHRLLHLFN